MISKVLRYDPCVTRDHTVLPATHTQTIPAFTPQLQGITALRLVPTYTAWWTEAHRCEKLAQGFYAACPAETRTHDLLIAKSDTLPTATALRRHVLCSKDLPCKSSILDVWVFLETANQLSVVWCNTVRNACAFKLLVSQNSARVLVLTWRQAGGYQRL